MAEEARPDPQTTRNPLLEMKVNVAFAKSRLGILLAVEVVLAVIIVGLSTGVGNVARVQDSLYVLLLICFYAMITCFFLWVAGFVTKEGTKNPIFAALVHGFTAILYFSSAVAVLALIHRGAPEAANQPYPGPDGSIPVDFRGIQKDIYPSDVAGYRLAPARANPAGYDEAVRILAQLKAACMLAVVIVGLSNGVSELLRLTDSFYVLLLICFYAMVTCFFLWVAGFITKEEIKSPIFVALVHGFSAILYFSSAVAVFAQLHRRIRVAADIGYPIYPMPNFDFPMNIHGIGIYDRSSAYGGRYRSTYGRGSARGPYEIVAQIDAACGIALIASVIHGGHAVLAVLGLV
ncbi:uncharacterized protein LOC135378320 [Ornithodoros turicata]|uniref:uncharacterized protein LOC135378320 n=1 Tax=Ornithodoros turicata TaxID=34597 RepID=UPI003139342A